jgi:hypothetical protein
LSPLFREVSIDKEKSHLEFQNMCQVETYEKNNVMKILRHLSISELHSSLAIVQSAKNITLRNAYGKLQSFSCCGSKWPTGSNVERYIATFALKKLIVSKTVKPIVVLSSSSSFTTTHWDQFLVETCMLKNIYVCKYNKREVKSGIECDTLAVIKVITIDDNLKAGTSSLDESQLKICWIILSPESNFPLLISDGFYKCLAKYWFKESTLFRQIQCEPILHSIPLDLFDSNPFNSYPFNKTDTTDNFEYMLSLTQ